VRIPPVGSIGANAGVWVVGVPGVAEVGVIIVRIGIVRVIVVGWIVERGESFIRGVIYGIKELHLYRF
jgi:hypothetical protein